MADAQDAVTRALEPVTNAITTPVARIATYELTSGAADNVLHRVRSELMPRLQHRRGYLGYAAHKIDSGRVMSVSHWATKHDAEAANAAIEEWTQEAIAGSIRGGEVFFSNAALPDRL